LSIIILTTSEAFTIRALRLTLGKSGLFKETGSFLKIIAVPNFLATSLNSLNSTFFDYIIPI
jgi:hypothetical protein